MRIKPLVWVEASCRIRGACFVCGARTVRTIRVFARVDWQQSLGAARKRAVADFKQAADRPLLCSICERAKDRSDREVES